MMQQNEIIPRVRRRLQNVFLRKEFSRRLKYNYTLPSELLTVFSAGENRKNLVQEIYSAIEPRYHSQVFVEDERTWKSNGQMSDSRFIKRRITTVLRWALMQEKLGLAVIVLGHVMPPSWFEGVGFSDVKWPDLLTAPFLDVIAGNAKQLLEQEMCRAAPLRLLENSQGREFGNLIDAFISYENVWGCGGSLKSVAWIAGRIAQR